MNEWSPKGFYSGSATADQRPQSNPSRQFWEENWDQGRVSPNLNAMNGYWSREGPDSNSGPYQIMKEDVAKGPNPFAMKKKSCASDPRFKRVISTDVRNRTDSENIQKMGKTPEILQDQINEEKFLADKMMSYLNNTNESSMYGSMNMKKFKNSPEDVVTKDVGFNRPMKYADGYDSFRFQNVTYQDPTCSGDFKDSDKIKINFKTNLKRSASDCTLQTRTNFAEDNDEELRARIRNYPSGTKLGNVHEWIKNSDVSPEKRRSVITVIGQTQTKSLKQILSEINQRRKLAKELDKHALCKAIMETTENRPDVKNLIAKIDFVLPDGKVIYSTEKVYLCKDKSKFKIEKDIGQYTHKSMEILQAGDQPTLPAYTEGLNETEQHRKRREMIPERDSSVSHVGKRNRLKRSTKKSSTGVKEKESCKNLGKSFGRSSKIMWSVFFLAIIATSAFLGYLAMKPSGFLFITKFFKPKTTAWYEKILY